jgi:hypothetical protein
VPAATVLLLLVDEGSVIAVLRRLIGGWWHAVSADRQVGPEAPLQVRT